MKIIKLVEPRCPCHSKLFAYTKQVRGEGTKVAIGTVVECDCGRVYKLTDHQRDGEFWEEARRGQ